MPVGAKPTYKVVVMRGAVRAGAGGVAPAYCKAFIFYDGSTKIKKRYVELHGHGTVTGAILRTI